MKQDINYNVNYEDFIEEVKKKYSTFKRFKSNLKNGGKYGDYLIAEHNGWLEKTERVLNEKWEKYKEDEFQKFSIYLKKKYKTYKDVIKNKSTHDYYKLTANKGWLKRLKHECYHEEDTNKPNGYWDNFEHCLEESKKYKTRKEFAAKGGGAYYYARNRYMDEEKTVRWIDVMIPSVSLESKLGNVYCYRFSHEKVVYVGITINPKRRDQQHRNQKGSSAVKSFCKENDIPMPPMEILESNISILKSTILEKKYVEKFKNEGFKVLNKAKCGLGSSSVGTCKRNSLSFYDYDMLLDHIKNVKKFKTYEEFIGDKNNWTPEYTRAFYLSAIRKINKACGFKPGHNCYYNFNEFLEDVRQKYKTYNDFKIKDGKKHYTNEWTTAMRHNEECWLLKTVEILFPEHKDEVIQFLSKSNNKMLNNNK